MPYQDSIQIVSDSSKLMLDSVFINDSIRKADSIATVDSVALADSLKLHAFKGYDGIPIVSTPGNEGWVFLLLMFCFGLVVLAFVRSISPPWYNIVTYFSSKERTSIFTKTSIDSFEQKLYFFIFTVLIIALMGYFINYNINNSFGFLGYFKFCIVTLAFFAFKYVFFKIIEYVFFDKGTMKLLVDSYLNMLVIMSVGFFVLLSVSLYSRYYSLFSVANVALVIVVLCYVLFALRLIQIFLHKFADSLYIMLYLCTLEILPVIILFQVFQRVAISV